jgi:hypothetical protein
MVPEAGGAWRLHEHDDGSCRWGGIHYQDDLAGVDVGVEVANGRDGELT